MDVIELRQEFFQHTVVNDERLSYDDIRAANQRPLSAVNAKVTERAGADRAKDLFSADAAMDHFVVGDPNVPNDGSQRSAADSGDEDDDDDLQPDTVLKAGLGGSNSSATAEAVPELSTALSQSVQQFFGELPNEIRQGLGSNNWVVSGAHTATGKPLLANDTHLPLGVPNLFYPMHLSAGTLNVGGSSVAGVPFIILGQNEHISWGATVSYADVTDTFQEQIVPDSNSPNGLSIVHEGQYEPIIPIPEVRVIEANAVGFGTPAR